MFNSLKDFIKLVFDIGLYKEIFQSLNKNKLRSLLSGFTVAFAIMLFTILFGIANGFQNTFQNEFAGDANNSIFIYSGRTSKAVEGYQTGRKIKFDNELFKIIKEKFKNDIEFITGRIYKNVVASFKSEKDNYSVRAVNPDHQFIEKSEIKEGRFINKIDIENNTKNIVIGNLVVEDLFGDTNPIGQYLDLNKIKFKVVGVFVERTEGSDSNEARVIYMPISTAQKIYGNDDYIDQINLTYNPSLSEKEAILLGEKIINEIKDINFVAAEDQSAVRIRNRARENQEVSQFNNVLAILVLIIGLGTLVAGVVGISNIMIFIVKERTKEIGIRKALGAPPISIILIIIFESIFITAIAGYIGLLIGGAILNSIDLEDYWITDPSVSSSLVFLASITLVIAGTIAGYIPAKRAASIKPIEALRDE
tara:strand:- start:1 stop:1266 length:1266 start_codon:yes stop_codon:yes gene_type:complete